MELEEILRNYIEAKKLLESSELLVETGLVDFTQRQGSKAADVLLAEVTKADADLLAKTTKADADLLAEVTRSDANVLARATENAAGQLRKSNEISLRWMTQLTIVMITVGIIQIIIAIISFLK